MICATTANFPGFDVLSALRYLQQGAIEPFWGRLSMAHVQLCPQNPGRLTPEFCEKLMDTYPHTQFRLHANARVLEKHVLWDLSMLNSETAHYFKQLADISRVLKAPAYSLHAGYRENCNLQEMLDRYWQLQEWFGDIPVAIEGLYPSRHRPQLMDSIDEYRFVFESGAKMAIDLSHLQIIASSDSEFDWKEVKSWLSSSQCLEIHVSENDGTGDQHRAIKASPRWMEALETKTAICFSEGRLK